MNVAENMTNEKLMERERRKFDARIDTLVNYVNAYKSGRIAMSELADYITWLAPRIDTAATLYKVAERAYESMDGKE